MKNLHERDNLSQRKFRLKQQRNIPIFLLIQLIYQNCMKPFPRIDRSELRTRNATLETSEDISANEFSTETLDSQRDDVTTVYDYFLVNTVNCLIRDKSEKF